MQLNLQRNISIFLLKIYHARKEYTQIYDHVLQSDDNEAYATCRNGTHDRKKLIETEINLV